MQCQYCNEHTATIHLTEISGGQRVETHLCEGCAQQQGLAVKNQIPLNELLSSLLAVEAQAGEQGQASASGDADAACPSCGMTLRTFSKKSLLGCPKDYEVFNEQLAGLIAKSQGGHTEHCGKVPSRVPTDTKSQVESLNLRRQLEEAVRDENYEIAAKLRDEIAKLP